MSQTPPPAEVIRADRPAGPFRAALFDFDGTLSLVRGGWVEVMAGQMVAVLRDCGAPDSGALRKRVLDAILEENGRPALVQMARLAEMVRELGTEPPPPGVYLAEYAARLGRTVEERIARVYRGEADADALAVPGARQLLEALSGRGVELILASGTERVHVVREADLLGLSRFFGEHVYAPGPDDAEPFRKAAVIATTLERLNIGGEELVGFGDGVVETAEVARVGGLAVGVASREDGGTGVDAEKRERLIRAGAHVIVADLRGMEWLS